MEWTAIRIGATSVCIHVSVWVVFLRLPFTPSLIPYLQNYGLVLLQINKFNFSQHLCLATAQGLAPARKQI